MQQGQDQDILIYNQTICEEHSLEKQIVKWELLKYEWWEACENLVSLLSILFTVLSYLY